MGNDRVFMSYNEFMKTYLPRSFEEEIEKEIMKRGPEEFGKYLAQKAMESLQKKLGKISL